MKKEEKKIRAIVEEEYWITENEQQFLLAYRKANKDIQSAVNRLLEVEEEANLEIGHGNKI
jgi:hypothetical protein